MPVEFKQTVSDVFVGEYYDVQADEFHCIAVMQSMDDWSAYIDGDAVGSGFADSNQAQSFAVKALSARVQQRQRDRHTLIAFAAFAMGAFVFWAAQGGYFNTVSRALAAAITSKEDMQPTNSTPVAGSISTTQLPAAGLVSEHSVGEARVTSGQEAEVAAVVPMPVAPLVRQPRDNISTFAPRPQPSPSRVVVTRDVPDRIQVSRAKTRQSREWLPRAKPQKSRKTLASIKRKKQRAAAARRQRTARMNILAKKRAAAHARRETQKRAAKRLANIKAAKKKKAYRQRIARRIKIAKRNRIAKRTKIARRNRIARRRANRRISRRPRRRSALRRRLTFRQYQMLRNRIIAQRIRNRRRFAR